MVKVYYSYDFDKAVGMVASTQCNFAVDRKSILEARWGSWWCRGAVNMGYWWSSRLEKC